MADMPFMKFVVGDYLTDTQHLTTEQHGAYLLLMFNYWQRGKALPGDSARLAGIARLSLEKWKEIEHVLNKFFSCSEDAWIHARIEQDLANVRATINKRAKAGKASGEARKNKSRTHVRKQPRTHVEQNKTKISSIKKGDISGEIPPKEKFILPDWMPVKQWGQFLESRNLRRRFMTDRAKEMAVEKLKKLMDQGFDPVDVLNQSIYHSWDGLFEIKGEYREKLNGSAAGNKNGFNANSGSSRPAFARNNPADAENREFRRGQAWFGAADELDNQHKN